MERSAGIELELKDLDTSKRTAVIKHAVYTSVDKVKDISTKGMFNRSWKALTPDFLFNHKEGATVGSVKGMSEDDAGAYTQVKFGNWTLGNDVLEMADEGVLKGASFGYITEKKEFVQIKGQKARKLKEVQHLETSLLTVLPAHPEAGIVTLNKSFENLQLKQLTSDEQSFLQALIASDMNAMQALIALASTLDVNSDLYTWIMYQISRRADGAGSIMSQLYWDAQRTKSLKSHVAKLENYCHKANASDETIILLQNSIDEYKQIISDYDTADTRPISDQSVSDEEIKAISDFIHSLN